MAEPQNTATARRFFKRAIGENEVSGRVVTDKSGANLAGLSYANVIPKLTGVGCILRILQHKHLNNILEQDLRCTKRITGPMVGFKGSLQQRCACPHSSEHTLEFPGHNGIR